jgi:phosphatidylserine decarboxylase
MVREGYPFVLVPAVLTITALLLGYWIVALIFGGVTLFMAYFFRDPERQIPVDSGIVVAPADGRVTRVERMDATNINSPIIVSIFLSPLDVHVNRSPISGVISDVTYTKGKFLMATNEQASLVNEQNALTIKGEDLTVMCKQVAGILARRIVCWKKPHDRVTLGERFGLIKFSSRTDLIVPDNVDILVKVGARVQGGATIIGRIRR